MRDVDPDFAKAWDGIASTNPALVEVANSLPSLRVVCERFFLAGRLAEIAEINRQTRETLAATP